LTSITPADTKHKTDHSSHVTGHSIIGIFVPSIIGAFLPSIIGALFQYHRGIVRVRVKGRIRIGRVRPVLNPNPLCEQCPYDTVNNDPMILGTNSPMILVTNVPMIL